MYLCYVESLTNNFQVMSILKTSQFLKKSKGYTMVFSENWLQNHPQFLLKFLIHIDVLMLRRNFELILTETF